VHDLSFYGNVFDSFLIFFHRDIFGVFFLVNLWNVLRLMFDCVVFLDFLLHRHIFGLLDCLILSYDALNRNILNSLDGLVLSDGFFYGNLLGSLNGLVFCIGAFVGHVLYF